MDWLIEEKFFRRVRVLSENFIINKESQRQSSCGDQRNGREGHNSELPSECPVWTYRSSYQNERDT
jgi:hypothetical protein